MLFIDNERAPGQHFVHIAARSSLRGLSPYKRRDHFRSKNTRDDDDEEDEEGNWTPRKAHTPAAVRSPKTPKKKEAKTRGGPSTQLGDLPTECWELVAQKLMETSREERNLVHWSRADTARDAGSLMRVGDRGPRQQEGGPGSSLPGTRTDRQLFASGEGSGTAGCSGACWHIGRTLMSLLEQEHVRLPSEDNQTQPPAAAAAGTGSGSAASDGRAKRRERVQQALSEARKALKRSVREMNQDAMLSKSTKTECMKAWPLNDKDLKPLPKVLRKNPHGPAKIQLFSLWDLKQTALRKCGGLTGLVEKIVKRKGSLEGRREHAVEQSDVCKAALASALRAANLPVPPSSGSRCCADFVRNAGKRKLPLEQVVRVRQEVEFFNRRTSYERERQAALGQEESQARQWQGLYGAYGMDLWLMEELGGGGGYDDFYGGQPRRKDAADRLRSDDELSSLALEARQAAIRRWLADKASLEQALADPELPGSLHGLVTAEWPQPAEAPGGGGVE